MLHGVMICSEICSSIDASLFIGLCYRDVVYNRMHSFLWL